MKYRITIISLLCLICGSLSSQSWVIDYHGDHPSGRTHFNTGFVDEDGVTFLSGFLGLDNNKHEILLMKIEPEGSHSEFIYHKDGCSSEADCIIETDDHRLFIAGRISNGENDNLLILLFNKDLTLLKEAQFEKEIEAISFDLCNATKDTHGNVIVSTALKLPNEWGGYYHRGLFYKFDSQCNLINHRFIIGEEPDPEFYLSYFRLRQMWYQENSEELLCLVPAYGNVMSFVTFDSAFNYIQEFPIWRDHEAKEDHTLFNDSYTDYWYSENEALFFSSRGDHDHNKLRVSKVNTQGEFLEYIHLNERQDTIDDAATRRCMATANDSTFYFSFYQHTLPCFPGTAVVYMLNSQLEIIGRYIDDRHDHLRSYLILPTNDGGCISVNDSCDWSVLPTHGHPIITKLNRDHFETIPLSLVDAKNLYTTYPNPAEEVLYIPLGDNDFTQGRCQVYDLQGRIVIDRIVHADNKVLRLELYNLKRGIYSCQLQSEGKTVHSEIFIKK